MMMLASVKNSKTAWFLIQTVATIVLIGVFISNGTQNSVWSIVIMLFCIFVLWANLFIKSPQTSTLDTPLFIPKEEALFLLSKYRHESMNQIQLVKAYSQLGKYDRMSRAIETLVSEARRQNEFSHLLNPILSYAAVSAAFEYTGAKLEIHLSENFSGRTLNLGASMRLANFIYDLFALAQELQEDTSADVNWVLTIQPEGQGLGFKLALLGEDVTEGYREEIKNLLGNHSFILQDLHNLETEHLLVEPVHSNIYARFVSIDGLSVFE